MFTNVSMTGTGIVVFAITTLLQSVGQGTVDQNAIANFALVGGQIIGGIFTLWGQIRRNDLVAGLFRKIEI